MIKPINGVENKKVQQKQQQDQKAKQYQMTKQGILVDNFVKEDKGKVDLSYKEFCMPKTEIKSDKTSSFNMFYGIMKTLKELVI